MKLYKALMLAFALSVTFVNAQSKKISETEFGKGMVNHVAKDSTWSVKFAPRIQMLSSTPHIEKYL